MAEFKRSPRKKMSTPISRRDFFRTLVPSWATRGNLVAGAIGAGVVVAVALVISFLREVGFLSVLKMAAIGLGLVGVLWLFVWIVSLVESAFKKSPPAVQAVVVVLSRFAVGVALCAFGAFAYNRWRATDDKTGFIMTTSVILVLAIIDEWKKRRANKSPQTTTGSSAPSRV